MQNIDLMENRTLIYTRYWIIDKGKQGKWIIHT